MKTGKQNGRTQVSLVSHRWAGWSWVVLCLAGSVGGRAAEAGKPVSFFREVTPIFKRSCNGCHNPNKMKSDVDTSTYAGLAKGGKHGPNFIAGDPAKSLLLEEITGKEPSMPKEGDPLSAAEVSLIERWIREGAKDDTPADAYSTRLKEPPTYAAHPVITSMVFSADGSQLAISGYHEVFLYSMPDAVLKHRLVGESPRVESVSFSPDGKRLAVSGGAPARFGEIQIWKTEDGTLERAFKLTSDSLYGVSWSPDGGRIAFGGSDKSVRVVSVADGKEKIRFDNHSDWVFRTTWLPDGNRLLSGSRDRAMKLINASNGQFIDDINKLLEPVVSMARHPKEEWALYGGADGGVRVYRIKENQERTAANNDVNLVKELERQPGAVYAVAYAPNGSRIAVGGVGGEVRLYAQDGKRVAALGGHGGAVFSVAFDAEGKKLYTGGFDGLVRVFQAEDGKLVGVFTPVPSEALRLTAGQ